VRSSFLHRLAVVLWATVLALDLLEPIEFSNLNYDLPHEARRLYLIIIDQLIDSLS